MAGKNDIQYLYQEILPSSICESPNFSSMAFFSSRTEAVPGTLTSGIEFNQ